MKFSEIVQIIIKIMINKKRNYYDVVIALFEVVHFFSIHHILVSYLESLYFLNFVNLV